MPRNTAVIIVSLILVVMATGAWQQRNASTTSSKLKILSHNHNESGPRRTAKLSGPIDIKIELRGEAPARAGDTYRVAAVFSSEQNLNDVKLQWILGSSVEMDSGSIDYSVNLVAGEAQEIEVSLRAKSPGPQRVQIRASSFDDSARFAVSAHYNSQPTARDFATKSNLLKPSAGADSGEANRKSQGDTKVFY